MRKAFVIMIAVILMFGAAGCESLRTAYEGSSAPDAEVSTTPDAEVSQTPDAEVSTTPDAEVSTTPDVISEADVENAINIKTAINAHNALNPNSMLPDGITPEDAKEELLSEQLWPMGLTDKEEKAAWELIEIKDGWADLTPEAREAMQRLEEEQEQAVPDAAGDKAGLTQANACNIANAINAYNALNPNSVLPDGITLEEAKETVGQLWPNGLSDEEEKAAWELIVYKNGIAEVKGLG